MDLSEDLPPEGVNRAHRPAIGAEPFPQLGGGAGVVGDGGDDLGFDAAVGDEVVEAGGQGAGLAGTRGRNDPGGACEVADGFELVRGEGFVVGWRRGRDRCGLAEVDGLAVDHDVVERVEGVAGTAVDPGWGAVGEQHVGGSAGGGADGGGLVRPPPHRRAVAGRRRRW